MRRTKIVKVGDLLTDFLKDSPHIAAKLAEARLPEYWQEVVGAPIASYTTSMNLHRGIFYVSFSSSIVRHEVLMRREWLKEELNSKMGFRLIKSVIVK